MFNVPLFVIQLTLFSAVSVNGFAVTASFYLLLFFVLVLLSDHLDPTRSQSSINATIRLLTLISYRNEAVLQFKIALLTLSRLLNVAGRAAVRGEFTATDNVPASSTEKVHVSFSCGDSLNGPIKSDGIESNIEALSLLCVEILVEFINRETTETNQNNSPSTAGARPLSSFKNNSSNLSLWFSFLNQLWIEATDG